MSNITLETVSESLLPVVADAELDLAFVNGQYSIVNYDDMMSTLRSLQEQINSYSYQVEDRQAVKKFKAAVNNYSKKFASVVKETQTALFGQVNQQKAELVGVMSEISNTLNAGLQADDARIKAEKYVTLEEAFASAKTHFAKLSDSTIVFDDVISSSWLNLTTSPSAAIKELDARLQALNDLCENPSNPEKDPHKNVAALSRVGWNGLKALNYILEQERLAQQALEALAKKSALAEESTKDKAATSTEEKPSSIDDKATILISKSDLKKVENIFKQLKIDYSVIM